MASLKHLNPEDLRRSAVARLGLTSEPQLASAAGGFLLREGDGELKGWSGGQRDLGESGFPDE